jgi:GT2 family glycosyltransferase
MTKPRTAAVVVCVASHEREEMLRACVDSLLAGTRRPDELFVVVDQNPSLHATLSATLPAEVRVMQTPRQGNSEGRNVGIRTATSDVVAFVDDDAAVEPAWLERIVAAFDADPELVGAGGAVVPRFLDGRRWLPDELLWVVGCTYAGHRTDAGPIRNPIGCNMAFRRDALLEVGAFATEFGKQGDKLVICDETELCLRLERAYGPGRITFVPDARVLHNVPPSRITWKGLYRRCLMEGLSKGRLQRRYAGRALASETGYVRRLLLRSVPAMAAGGLLRRDIRAVQGAGAIVMTLAVTSAAFVAGLAAREPEAVDA